MKKRGIPAWLSSPLFLSLLSAIACISVMYGRNNGKLLLPEDSAYLAMSGARNLVSGVVRGLESGAMSLPQLENPLYAAIVVPGALLCRPGELFAPAIWLILLGLVFTWWLIRTVKSLGKLIVGGWPGDALAIALGVSAPIVIAMFSCGGGGLQAVIVAALWLSWIDSGQGRSRSWWLSPSIFSIASAFSGSAGWTYPLVGALTAAFFYSRTGGILSRRVWPAVTIGFIPALLIAGMWSSGGGISNGSIPETYFPSVSWLSKFYSLIPPIIWQGIWPSSVIPVMLPGAGLLFLLGLMQPGNNRIWVVMGGLIVLVGLINGGLFSVPSFTPFIVISFSGIVRLSEMVPEAWRKGLLKTAAWGWILCAVIGLVLSIDQYGEKSARTLLGTVNMMGRIPANYSGMILSDNPGFAAWFSGRSILDWPRKRGIFRSGDSRQGWPVLSEIQKTNPDSSQVKYVISGILPADPGTPPEITVICGYSPISGIIETRLMKVGWGSPAANPGLPGWSIVDSLDCVEPISEHAHEYKVRTWGQYSQPEGVIFSSPGEKNRVDSGWIVDGSEEFTVQAAPGRPVVLIARILADCPLLLGVEWNGVSVSSVPVAERHGVWQEILLFQNNGEGVGKVNHVKIANLRPDECRYISFHYWIMQNNLKAGDGRK